MRWGALLVLAVASAVLYQQRDQLWNRELAALSPATEGLYARLGWRFWRGPLSIRTETGLIPTPDEQVMFLRLPKTPPLDDTLPLSAEWRPGEVW